MLFQSCGLVLDSNAKTKKSASVHEVGAVWIYYDNVAGSDIHSTDTHDYVEAVFDL